MTGVNALFCGTASNGLTKQKALVRNHTCVVLSGSSGEDGLEINAWHILVHWAARLNQVCQIPPRIYDVYVKILVPGEIIQEGTPGLETF
jgi:hypothetical protein